MTELRARRKDGRADYRITLGQALRVARGAP